MFCTFFCCFMHFSKIFPLSSHALIEGAGNAHKSEGRETFFGARETEGNASAAKRNIQNGTNGWFELELCVSFRVINELLTGRDKSLNELNLHGKWLVEEEDQISIKSEVSSPLLLFGFFKVLFLLLLRYLKYYGVRWSISQLYLLFHKKTFILGFP